VWEEEIYKNLEESLPVLALTEERDRWCWELEDSGVFTVKSMYLALERIFSLETLLGPQELRILSYIWKSLAPSKVIAFSWRLFRNRLPTRGNLVHRGIHLIGDDLNCVHCHGQEEVAAHLFLFCDVASMVWKVIFRWLGLVIIIPPNMASLYECFLGAAGNKKARIGFSLIWHATVWMLWKSRNKIIFSNGVLNPEEVVDMIKLLSWRWGLSRHKIPVCLFYEWCWDPGSGGARKFSKPGQNISFK
jgi:hypothetical protein